MEGVASDASRHHLTQERGHHRDRTGTGWQKALQVVPSVSFGFLHELQGGDTWGRGWSFVGNGENGHGLCAH